MIHGGGVGAFWIESPSLFWISMMLLTWALELKVASKGSGQELRLGKLGGKLQSMHTQSVTSISRGLHL